MCSKVKFESDKPVCDLQGIASFSRQEPQPAGTAKWPTTLRFGKILATTSVVRSIENPQDILQKIHRSRFTSSFHIYNCPRNNYK